jgi:hypothetical protein
MNTLRSEDIESLHDLIYLDQFDMNRFNALGFTHKEWEFLQCTASIYTHDFEPLDVLDETDMETKQLIHERNILIRKLEEVHLYQAMEQVYDMKL